MRIPVSLGRESDAHELAALHTAVVEDSTWRFGRGVWSWKTSESGTLHTLRTSLVLVACRGKSIVGTFELSDEKALGD